MKQLTNRIRKRIIAVAVTGAAAIAAMMLSACGPQEVEPTKPPAPTAAVREAGISDVPPAPPVDAPAVPLASPLASPLESPLAGDWRLGQAGIDRVTLRVDATAPQALAATVKGYLGDACTQLGAITQVREGNVIRVSIGTLRPANRMCAQVIKDFEVDVMIEVAGLAPGSYTVDVNGVPAQFDIDASGPVVK